MQQITALNIDLATLRRAVGGGSYVRGAEYARQGAVLQATWDAEENALCGMVCGHGTEFYEAAAFFSLTIGRPANAAARSGSIASMS